MRERLTLSVQSVFHVKAVPHDPGLLDLEVAEEEEFSPDKLRATLERLYMTVVCYFGRSVSYSAANEAVLDCGHSRVWQTYCSSALLERT